MPKALPVLDVTSPICCAPVAAGPMGEDAALGLALRLKALADPTRVRIMSMLLAAPGTEICTCDLAVAVGLSEPTTSHHLAKLTRSGLLRREQRGKWAYFSLDPEAAERLTGIVRFQEVST